MRWSDYENEALVAATNRYLLEAVAEGKFRQDLFHCLAVGVLTLSPWRERDQDLTL
jgi:transcriptional regulator with GAF, ATPase, and Fis domain